MSLRTWGTPLLYYAFHHKVECFAAELSNPHVDDGYLACDDGKSSIRRLINVRHDTITDFTSLLAISRIGERVMRAIASEKYDESSSTQH